MCPASIPHSKPGEFLGKYLDIDQLPLGQICHIIAEVIHLLFRYEQTAAYLLAILSNNGSRATGRFVVTQ